LRAGDEPSIAVWLCFSPVTLHVHTTSAGIEVIMGFKDLGDKNAAPHVDTPAQAEARAQATADLKAKADAKAAKNAAQREGKPHQDPAKPGPAKDAKGGPAPK
jgi:hypothetical protein